LQKLSALKQTVKDAWIKLFIFMLTKPSMDTTNFRMALVAVLEINLGIASHLGGKIHGKGKLTKFVM
jgi:hypothetical protein